MTAQVIDFPGPTVSEAFPGFEDMPPVMSPKTLGAQIEVSVASLARWRTANIGPAYIEPRGLNMVRYAKADVIAWLMENKKPAVAAAGQNKNLEK